MHSVISQDLISLLSLSNDLLSISAQSFQDSTDDELIDEYFKLVSYKSAHFIEIDI